MQNRIGLSGKSRLLLSGAISALGFFGCATSAGAAVVLMTFGGTTNTDASGRKWNDVTVTRNQAAGSPGTATGTPLTLLSSANVDSTYRLTVGNSASTTNKVGFDDINFGGGIGGSGFAGSPTGSAAALGYPTTSTMNSGFGNTGTFNTVKVQDVLLTLSNLNAGESYAFTLFASRATAGGTDSRQTEYDITGGAAGTAPTTLLLEAGNNTGNTVSASGFTPDVSGKITIDIKAGPLNNNNTGANLYYLNVLQVNSTSVPEPTGLAAVGISALTLMRRRRR